MSAKPSHHARAALTALLSRGATSSARRRKAVEMSLAAAVVGGMLAGSAPAGAITYGEFDGVRHPNTGAMVAEWRKPGRKDLFCSGTLISATVFLTAGHCTDALEHEFGIAPDDIEVTLDPVFDRTGPYHSGTFYTDPEFGYSGQGGSADPHDLGVVVLDEPVPGVTPAQLAERGLLDELDLRDEWFTAVGYGAVRDSKAGGMNDMDHTNSQRNFATRTFLSLNPAWLNLSGNPSTGSGGTCYGDSGGPQFLRDTNMLVALTGGNDAACRAMTMAYRLDIDSARSFLDDYVALP